MRNARPPKEIPPPLELECLKVLWALGESSVRAVQEQLDPKRKLAYTTVMTLLERLVKKGGAARRKQGRAFLYSARMERDAIRRRAIQELTDTLFEGSPELLLEYAKEPSPHTEIAKAAEAQ